MITLTIIPFQSYQKNPMFLQLNGRDILDNVIVIAKSLVLINLNVYAI